MTTTANLADVLKRETETMTQPLTTEQRNELISERTEIEQRLNAKFVNPKDIRRIDEIRSLLLTDGASDKVMFTGKPRRSNRVTSFTKNRR